MIKKISFLFITLLVLISSIVFASDDAPPAIPVELWGGVIFNGAQVSDGLTVTAEVDGLNYAQPSQTLNGYYNVILVNGDRPLTYNNDRNCSIHWAAGEACVPCIDEADCIEGPQDDANILIKIDSSGAMPYVDWVQGSVEEIGIVNPIGDWDQLGCVDMTDFGYFANHYNEVCTPMVSEVCDFYDIYRDYVIDMTDFGVFANHYGEGCGG